MAQMRRRIYYRLVDLQRENQNTPGKLKEIREEEMLLTLRQWRVYIQRPGISGAKLVEAILPHFNEWMSRNYGKMIFHLTQILTGHGSFGSYLCRIQKRDSDICEHCDGDQIDTPQHTLGICNA